MEAMLGHCAQKCQLKPGGVGVHHVCICLRVCVDPHAAFCLPVDPLLEACTTQTWLHDMMRSSAHTSSCVPCNLRT